MATRDSTYCSWRRPWLSWPSGSSTRFAASTRRTVFLAHASTLVWMHLWFLGPDLFSWLDPGLPVLALLVAGSAAAAVGVVSHGLARAEHLL